jgi:hypothetical protein
MSSTIEANRPLKLNLKTLSQPHVAPAQPSKIQSLTGPSSKPSFANFESEERIIQLTNQIDEQILYLDNRMDMVLEQHEKDFLSAYRKHMIAV